MKMFQLNSNKWFSPFSVGVKGGKSLAFTSFHQLKSYKDRASVNPPCYHEHNLNLATRVSLFIYLGFYIAFNTVQVISRWVVGRAEETMYIQFVRVLYCKLPTNGKQLPAFPLEAVPGTEPRSQRWEARVLPLCHRGPQATRVRAK